MVRGPIKYKKVTENSVIFNILVVAVLAFMAGWGGHVAVQHASGRVDISAEYLKNLEDRTRLGKESILHENDLLQARIQELEIERVTLNQTLLENTPRGKSYITKVSLSPHSPAALKVDEKITVTFDYVIADGKRAYLYVRDFTPVKITHKVPISNDSKKTATVVMTTVQDTSFEATASMSGKGTTSRRLSLGKVGEIRQIAIRMIDDDTKGELLHEMMLPVQYTFK
jgi:hypothetical protein